jgi:hypothetical protein
VYIILHLDKTGNFNVFENKEDLLYWFECSKLDQGYIERNLRVYEAGKLLTVEVKTKVTVDIK